MLSFHAVSVAALAPGLQGSTFGIGATMRSNIYSNPHFQVRLCRLPSISNSVKPHSIITNSRPPGRSRSPRPSR
ncbi:hypothetical protein BCAR13_640034 [Paraburkholderia caribensis]|nr:hypothetical protein BCAR13_640034 [Paraburkholderia caribensis]